MENDFDQSVKDLLHYHKVGTDYIKKALLIDENSSSCFFLQINFV